LSTLSGGTLPRTSYQIVVETTHAPAFFDITDEVMHAVEASGVFDGMALVFSRHTTAAIRINENEPLLIADMEDFLRRIAPADAEYRHNDFDVRTANMTDDESPNGHSHCLSLLLSTSETVAIEAGRLLLGTWQRIFLIELDHPRRRDVLVKIVRG
jgi:secondary thiamine-phosphate synthase enzyme